MILGNFIFHYVVNQALTEGHPAKDYEHCVNRHQVKHKCTICADVCPAKVYYGKGSQKADFSNCENCNLCVAACPARCIASSSVNVSSYLKLLRVPEETVFIGTRQYEGACHLRVDCFAALPWEFLACLGLYKKAVFLTAGLPEVMPQAEEVWQKTLERLIFFFGKEEFHKRFVCSEQPVYEDGQQISRRDLFKKANDEIKSRISAFVPSESMMDGLLYRYLLREALAAGEADKPFGWVIPMISARCKGCGVCAKLCPQDAITVKREQGNFRIIFYPFLCNGCGLCQKTCIHNAVDGFGLTRTDRLKPMILFDSITDV